MYFFTFMYLFISGPCRCILLSGAYIGRARGPSARPSYPRRIAHTAPVTPIISCRNNHNNDNIIIIIIITVNSININVTININSSINYSSSNRNSN